METKFFDKNSITLDGRMDEAVWASVKEYSGFSAPVTAGGSAMPLKSSFRVLPCEDRIFVGVEFEAPDMPRVLAGKNSRAIWTSDCVEVFISPSGNDFDIYHFAVTVGGLQASLFYSEGGTIQPDPYAPEWKSAVYTGDDFWSVEFEIPLTAFYMTPAYDWSDKWRFNVCRDWVDYDRGANVKYYSWSKLDKSYKEGGRFNFIDGFPMRPAEDAIFMSSVEAKITGKSAEGYTGDMTVYATSPVDTEFTFASDCADSTEVALKEGENAFTVPCCFADEGRKKVLLQLTRKSDGKVFKRWYPVRVAYEPIKLALTLPEYRGNFYPGQDYSKVVGKVVAAKPVTVTLEGPGIGTKTVKPDADGNFSIDTPDFEVGDAMLTITDGVDTFTKKIRRLAPTGHTMTWVSGGNLILNGKPTLRRNMYAEYYMGCEVFKKHYDADNLHDTPEFCVQKPAIEPFRLIKGVEAPGGEALKDVRPCDEMFEKLDAVIEANRDRDFGYYYLEDEPECRGISPIYLKHMYDYITEKDPYHVVLIASRDARDFMDCCDWVETHPYINMNVRDGKRIPGRAINTLGKFVDRIASLNKADKCIGFLPTCFFPGSIYGAYPNFDEIICHTWAAMLPGGKSLWPYAYHDLNDRVYLYEGMRYIFSSFEALEELVLLAKRTDIIKTQEVHGVLYELNDEKMFVVVNMVDTPQKVTLDGISGTWYNFRHGGTLTGNTFELAPNEVLIGTSKVKDEGLPTYQEIVKINEEGERKRLSTGSLLLDQQLKLTTRVSGGIGKYRKLFDGVQDNYAMEMKPAKPGDGPRFLEVNMTKLKPTFTKIVIHGYQIDDATIKVMNGEEQNVPAIAEEKVGEYTKTFILADAICPDALRVEFGQRYLEVYELEVF